jgi:drug/metabolite transporter (DMT)-like permease
MNTALIGILFAVAATISWAAANILLRFGIAGMRILPATAVSLFGGLLYVLAVNLIFDPGAIGRIESRVFFAFALIGVVQFLGSRSLFYRGVALIGVGRATALGGGSPIMGSLLAVFFLGEIVTLSLASGILAVVIGTTIIVSDNVDTALAPHQSNSTNFISQAKLGFISIITSSFLYSAVQVFAKSLMGGEVSALAGSLIALGSGSLVLLFATAKNFKSNYDVSRHHLLLIFVAGMLASNGLMLSFLALERTPVVLVSPIIGITPLITLVLAAIFLRELEKLTFKVISGSIIVVAGVILVVLAK